jgi:hypothetical protein
MHLRPIGWWSNLGRDIDGAPLYQPKDFQREVDPAEKGVYILRRLDKELYKIGFSTELPTRIANIQKEVNAFSVVELTVCYSDPRTLESALHYHFRDKRVEGEWFKLSSDDVELIKGLDLDAFIRRCKWSKVWKR